MRTTLRRGLRVAAVALAAGSIVLSGCASPAEEQADVSGVAEEDRYGGTLNIGLSADPLGVDAAVVNQVWRHVARALSDSLVFLDPETQEIEPWLATDWTVSEDARTYSFTLRDDVTFNDGTALTGEVVKANLESLARPGIHTSARAIVEGISSITVPREDEVVVEFAEPNAAFLPSLSRAHAGIVSQASAEAPVEERQKSLDGSGPFRLVSYTDNQEIVLEAREDYDWAPDYYEHEGRAYLDGVTYKIIPEDSVRNGAVQSGDLDFIYWVDANYIPELEASGLTISYSAVNPATGTEWPVNTSSPLLQDVRVRQALQHGVDRASLAAISSNGVYLVPKGPLSEENPYFSDQSEYLAYDPELSADLLDEAGWDEIGSDGIRVNDAGERLSLRFPRDGAVEQIVQEQWKQIGVELVLDPPLAAEANEKLLSGEYDLAYWYHSSPDADVLRANYGVATGSNRAFIAEDDERGQELDALLQEQNTLLDHDARQAVVDEAARLLVEDAYTLPLETDVDVWAYSPDLQDIKSNGLDQLLYDAWLQGGE
ncbi:ABC transporter substrate-binding protein [Microbacterium betulae]|uniref:ABC transporter substrate-binding protein n=1 Tax=Microbacterium betulae TaxID=2981139 RepID=A0AA97I657_9MICO|nr:ABC transporter substrate-binding protein [Microbacterium sp. AB]WOF23474.1 ABC transporter substrate-binding protein [Microbacterium sp. AB]